MIIWINEGYKEDMIEYDDNNEKHRIFIIDNLKSRAYNEFYILRIKIITFTFTSFILISYNIIINKEKYNNRNK